MTGATLLTVTLVPPLPTPVSSSVTVKLMLVAVHGIRAGRRAWS